MHFYVLPPPTIRRKIAPGKTPSPPVGGGGLGRGKTKNSGQGQVSLITEYQYLKK